MSSQPRAEGLATDPHGELARAAADGDLSAMRKLLDRVAPRVVRVVRKVLGPAHPDVDDVSQESLIALVRALPNFRGECAVEGYAARIAVRVAVAARHRAGRKRNKRRELEQQTPERLAPSVGERASASRRLDLLRGLLAELPAGQGETLALRVVLGASIKEIAEATEVPINTVRSRLRLAKQSLRQKIEESPALAEELEVSR